MLLMLTDCNRTIFMWNSLFSSLPHTNRPVKLRNVKVVFTFYFFSKLWHTANQTHPETTRKTSREPSLGVICASVFSYGLSSHPKLHLQPHTLKNQPCFPPLEWITRLHKVENPTSLSVQNIYLSVIQHFSLGGVGFKAQDSLSFVKLIFNSPRIHLFMATCGRGGIDLNPVNPLTLSLPDSSLWRLSQQNTLWKDGAVVGWDAASLPTAADALAAFKDRS